MPNPVSRLAMVRSEVDRLSATATRSAIRAGGERDGVGGQRLGGGGTVNYFFFEPPCPAAAGQAWMHAPRRFPTDLIS